MIKKVVINVGEDDPILIELTLEQAAELYEDLQVLFADGSYESMNDGCQRWQDMLVENSDELDRMFGKVGKCCPEHGFKEPIGALTKDEIDAALKEDNVTPSTRQYFHDGFSEKDTKII